MMVLRPSRVRPTAPFTAFIVVLLPLVPWAVISAEEAPMTEQAPVVAMDPTATDEPAATGSVVSRGGRRS